MGARAALPCRCLLRAAVGTTGAAGGAPVSRTWRRNRDLEDPELDRARLLPSESHRAATPSNGFELARIGTHDACAGGEIEPHRRQAP